MSDTTSDRVAVNVHDVIQIAPVESVRDLLAGKLAFVSEVKHWGVQAYVATFTGDAYVRLAWGEFEVIGPAPFVREQRGGKP